MSTPKFDEGRLMAVLVAPIVSEKATMVAEKSNAVTFKVLQNATKPEIKAAVELMFKVEVKGVSVVNTKGKTKRFGRSIGRRDNVRKAMSRSKPVKSSTCLERWLNHGSRQNETHFTWPTCRGESHT